MLRAIIHRTLTTCNKINAINVASAVTNSDILLNNVAEKKVKEKQNCEEIFLSPIFKTEKYKNYLDTIKFNILANKTKRNVIALGGVNLNNLKKIYSTRSIGVASISWIKKNGLK